MARTALHTSQQRKHATIAHQPHRAVRQQATPAYAAAFDREMLQLHSALGNQAVGEMVHDELPEPALPGDETAEPLQNFASERFVQKAAVFFRTYGANISELAIGLIPIVGDVYDAVTGIVGYSLVQGEKLDPIDRILSLAGIIPIPFVTGKILRLSRRAVAIALHKMGIAPIKVLKLALPKAISAVKRVWGKVVETLKRRFRHTISSQAATPHLKAARRGLAEHAEIKRAMRPFEGKLFSEGWKLKAVERTVGGKKRVDELWVNHQKKKILVVDTFTGRVETPKHHQKGWSYAQEPEIKKYLEQGYLYNYEVAIKHPEMLQ